MRPVFAFLLLYKRHRLHIPQRQEHLVSRIHSEGEIPAGNRSVSEALECVGPEDDMEMPKENGQSDRHSCSSYFKS